MAIVPGCFLADELNALDSDVIVKWQRFFQPRCFVSRVAVND